MNQNLSKNDLQVIASISGYRIEILEKIDYLTNLLSLINQDDYLKEKLVLKGGTALNLFHFNMPRLSVDIDLNYIGSRETLLYEKERPEVIKRLNQIANHLGLTSERQGNKHAGGKTVWRYNSVFGQGGKIEIDLNFMHRVTLLPTCELPAKIPEGLTAIPKVHLLDLHEIAAGKIMALQSRQKSRDIFDAALLANTDKINNETLRLCVVIYAAISGLNNETLTQKPITVERRDFHDQLIPLLTKGDLARMQEKDYLSKLEHDSKKLIASIFPLKDNEKEFLTASLEQGKIKPELITNDPKLQENIALHPAIGWHAYGKKLYVYIKEHLNDEIQFIPSSSSPENLKNVETYILDNFNENTVIVASIDDSMKINAQVRKKLILENKITKSQFFTLISGEKIEIGINDIVLLNDNAIAYQLSPYQNVKVTRIENDAIYLEPLTQDAASNREIPVYTPLPLLGHGYAMPGSALKFNLIKNIAICASPLLSGSILKTCMEEGKTITKLFYSSTDYSSIPDLLNNLKKQPEENEKPQSKSKGHEENLYEYEIGEKPTPH